MYKLKDETNIREIVKKIANMNAINESSVEELLIFKANHAISDILEVNLSDLDAVLCAEANHSIAQIFNLTQADLDNLISEYGKEIILGMLIGYLTKNK